MRYYLLNLYIRRVLAAVIADAACFALAGAITWFLLVPPFPASVYATAVAAGTLGSFAVLYYAGAYQLTVLGSPRRTLLSAFAAMGAVFAVALIAYFAVSVPVRSIEVMAHLAGLYFALILTERMVFRFISALPRFSQRVVVIGTSDLALAIADAVRARLNLGVDMVGFLSDELVDEGASIAGYPVLGKVHEIEKVVDREKIGRIVVASKSRSEYFPADELLSAKLRGRRVEAGVSFYERITGRVYLRDLRPSYLIFSDGFRLGALAASFKRLVDVTVSGMGLLCAAPVLGLCALAIRFDSRGPVLFEQERVGQDGRLFRLIKLRSMKVDAEKHTGPAFCTQKDERVTRVGRVLRKTRLDEVPQLWNVVRGEMSLVGPRPERPEFVDSLIERYPYFRLRSTLKPGITGWAQIRHGYVNEIEGFEEKLALDLYYMKYRSTSMDLLILWKTAKTVLLFRGV
jgi:sugar transferase (PEP-CTERM system associated)